MAVESRSNDVMLVRVISPYPYSGLKIMFDPTVEVTESTRIHTGLTMFSNVGGFVGLYLGYSLLDGGRIVHKLFQKFHDYLLS